MKRRALIIMLVLSLLVSGSGIVAMAADEAFVATIDGTGYNSLQAAVNAVENGTQDGTIVLQKNTTEDIQVSCDVYVDLNGHDIENVNVTDGTFYGTDSQTNDFEGDYGVIGSFTGNVQAAFSPEEDGYGYLMFSDNGTNASFHFVELRITDMTLRPQNEGEEEYNPSLYYKCAFKGDEVVDANVESFGVALSLEGNPSVVGLQKCGYSTFTDFTPGANGNTEQSTLLHGIMKEKDNLYLINKRNANLPIYGQAYLELANGEYVYGKAENRTLKEQTEKAYLRWTILNTGKPEDKEKQEALVEMKRRFSSVMQSWNMDETIINKQYNGVVYDAATWYEEFMALPVANADMSVDQLRQLTVDFFRLQQSFKWTPNTTFVYHDTEKQKPNVWSPEKFCDYTTLEPNVVYKGLPYCMTGAYEMIDGVEQPINTSIGKSGSIYKAMNYYDPATGVLDLAAIYARNGAQAVYDVLTSNCTHGLTWGWNRVSNSTTIYSTKHYTPANGALFVGDNLWNEYLYSEVVITNETTGAYEIQLTDNAVTAIMGGQPVDRWRNNYAKMQPGDGLLSDGHMRMCTGVRVKTDADDNIIPGESYVWYIDMNSNGSTDRYVAEGGGFENYIYTQANGNLVRDLGGIREHIDREGLNDYPGTPITFTQLYNEKYMPVTIPEFVDQARIETIRDQSKAYFEAAGELEKWNTYYAPKYQALIDNMGIEGGDVWFTNNNLNGIEQIAPSTITGMSCSIKSNYVISNVRITLQDSNGKVLLEEDPIIHTNDRTISIKISDKLLPVSYILTQETLTQHAGKGNKIIISVQLSTGEWVEALNAKLIAD